MLVGANKGGVEEQMLQVGITVHCCCHPLPDARLAPARETHLRAVPVPKPGRQVTPGTAGAHDPKHGFDEPPIVPSRATRITRLTGQEGFNAFPPVIAQHLAVHPDSVQKPGYDHISTTVNNPSPCH